MKIRNMPLPFSNSGTPSKSASFRPLTLATSLPDAPLRLASASQLLSLMRNTPYWLHAIFVLALVTYLVIGHGDRVYGHSRCQMVLTGSVAEHLKTLYQGYAESPFGASSKPLGPVQQQDFTRISRDLLQRARRDLKTVSPANLLSSHERTQLSLLQRKLEDRKSVV